jgi:hypothetical protein
MYLKYIIGFTINGLTHKIDENEGKIIPNLYKVPLHEGVS